MDKSIPDDILKLYCARYALLELSADESATHAMQIDQVNDHIADKVCSWLSIYKMDLSLYENGESSND